MTELLKEREKVAAIMRRLYTNRLTTASGGNVSMRVQDKILITPSQIDKAAIVTEKIGILTLEGKNLTPELRQSMESGMHLAVYHKRPDVRAVVHAHPVFATSFGISRQKINTSLAGEARAMLGEPSSAPYALMGTKDLASAVAMACEKTNVVLMENHGVIALGETLFQAYDRMEVLEACAKMTLITSFLGGAHELNKEQLREIDNLFE
jgi:L-fuculose-phosphate aldolase